MNHRQAQAFMKVLLLVFGFGGGYNPALYHQTKVDIYDWKPN
jgi:hypothetical protein